MRRARRRSVARALGAALLLATPLIAGCDATSETETHSGPLRVMVVGDSISQGLPGDATWRYWFAKAFADQHVPLEMVGPTTGEKDDIEAYELPWTQTAHAAQGGSTLDDHLPLVGSEVTTYHPDVVVIELGINDRKQHDSPATIEEQTHELADRIWDADPKVRIVWTQILEQASSERHLRVKHDRQTAAIDRRVAASLGTDPRVTIAHTQWWPGGRWRPVDDTTDGTHPNAGGQTLLAQRIAVAFHAMGLLPATPQIAHQRTWAPDPVPEAWRGPRGRLVVDWAKAAVACWTTSVRVVVRDASGRAVVRQTRPATPYDGDDHASYRLPPGRYFVTLDPIRHWMRGARSEPVAVALRPGHGASALAANDASAG